MAALKRCEADLGIKLLSLLDQNAEPLGEFVSDPVRLVDTLYVLCRRQAEERKLTDEDFGRAMAGDCIEQAAHAFVDELIDFFPNARVRGSLKRVMAASRKVGDRVAQRDLKKLDEMSEDQLADLLEKELLKRYSVSSGAAQESSAA